MNISSFYRDVLGAPLSNARWSWGAISPKSGQVFLRVWEDERDTVDGVDRVHILGPDWSRASAGLPERRSQVDMLRSGREAYGILCVAKDPNSKGSRRIKSFDAQDLLRFGRLTEDDGDVYATIVGTVPANAVLHSSGARGHPGIPGGITAADVRGALRRLADGASHPFGPSTNWDVMFHGRAYPPKAVLALAAERLAGRMLGPDDFQSGGESKCFRILTQLGFAPIHRKGSPDTRGDPKNSPEPRLHITQGGVDNGDKALLDRTRPGSRLPSWTIGKSAVVGDDVVINIAGHGLYATAKVSGLPKRSRRWANRYDAPLSSVRLIDPPIPMVDVRRAVPQLKWAVYPRGITTLSQELADQLRRLLHQTPKERDTKNGSQETLRTLALQRGQLDYKVQTKAKVVKAERTESKLVEDYEDWLRVRGRTLQRHRYGNLICDAYEEKTRNLIEAKSSINREYIRMGVGQLLDYAFQGKRLYGRPNMALLLPKRPNLKELDWLKPLRVYLVWREREAFRDNAGGRFCGR